MEKSDLGGLRARQKAQPALFPARATDEVEIGLQNEAGWIDEKEVGSGIVEPGCRKGMLWSKALSD